MSTVLAALCVFVFSFSSSGLTVDPSAHREIETDYTHYFDRYQSGLVNLLQNSEEEGRTAINLAKNYDPKDPPEATKWDQAELQSRFVTIRDARILREYKREYWRRITWRYPDDGCYSRAAAGTQIAFKKMFPLPVKIFAFGNLVVTNKNAPWGVGWRYHVAQMVQVGEERYVLDPSIEYERPLLLAQWLKAMNKNPEKIKIVVCEAGVVYPGSSCGTKTDGMESHSIDVQRSFLSAEFNRMRRLGRTSEL